MTRNHKHFINRFERLILALLVLIFSFVSSRQGMAKEILVLHSFHKGHVWNDSITQGIESVFSSQSQRKPAADLHYEYMDTERVQGAAYTQDLYEFFGKKYADARFDVIIATDDSAFRFLMEYQPKLFPGVPVVFCGVNYFEEFEMFGHEQFSGVVEYIDIQQTVETALSLHPKTQQVLVVVDRTDTSIAIIKTFIQTFKYFEDPSLFKFIEAKTLNELKQTLLSLSPDNVVLLVNFTVDRTGMKVSMREDLQHIIQSCPAPVYSFWDSYIGTGVLGGKMASGLAHGKKAAQMTLRLLNGEQISSIPVFKESLNRHIFDYQQMKRFHIKQDELPKGSELINIPFSFYDTYKKLVWTVCSGIAGLSLIILALVLNTFKRKRVEKHLKFHQKELERLSAKVFEMQESTCKKISFELHDEIGQSLTAATMNLTAIEKGVSPETDTAIPGLIHDTKEIIDHLSKQAHDLSLNLWPPMLRDFGLEPTLRWYLERIGAKADIRLEFDGSEFPERPSQEIETTLYRLSQEALNNVFKHANADRVDLSITRKQDGMIFFMVEDNGIGFDREEVLSDETMNDRLGILGMRERIAILGGKLTIWSEKDKGTCISASIPWQERI